MRKIWVVLSGIFGLFFMLAGGSMAGPQPVVADAQTVLQITQDDRVLGDPAAPITIIEYASLTCPHCARFANDVLPELKREWIDTGKAKLVLRDFPLDEPALRAAMIARCAPPGRFYAFAETFFASQEKWALTKDYREALPGSPSSAAWARTNLRPASRTPPWKPRSSSNAWRRRNNSMSLRHRHSSSTAASSPARRLLKSSTKSCRTLRRSREAILAGEPSALVLSQWRAREWRRRVSS